jgi:ABC-type multidrug transport system ATPase subunit
MSLLRIEAAALEWLYAAHLSLDAGVHVVLGTPRDGTAELVELSAGIRPPKRGLVQVDGQAPFSSPQTRSQIASLLQVETLSETDSVAEALSRALALRGGPNADQLLGEYGFLAWAGRAVRSLGPRERRTLALLVALSHEKARLLALFEPFSVVPELDLERVRSALEARAKHGACVVVATASTEDALFLGGSWLLLERGVLSGHGPHETTTLGASSVKALSVRSAEPRRLAQALAERAEILGLSFGETLGGRELLVFGPTPELVAEAVVGIAAERALPIEALSFVVPPLEALLAARDGWARGVYERSYAEGYAAAAQRPAGGVYGA